MFYLMIQEIGLIALVVLVVIGINFWAQRGISSQIYDNDSKRKEYMDSRSSLIDQTLAGIKNIKFSGWEALINEKMKDIRRKEAGKIRKMVEYIGFLMAANNLILPIGCFFCLSWYLFFDDNASLSSAYTFMMYLSYIFGPLDSFAYCLFLLGSAKLSLQRINHVGGLESYTGVKFSIGLKVGQIRITDGSFCWEKIEDSEINLRNNLNGVKSINFSVKPGECCYLLGMVGSGKSSLIYSIIDNLYCLEGEVKKNGRIALIPQEPFLLNDTLRNNILFGKEYDEEKYQHVVEICQLVSDLDILPAGDMTEIGERGINLSGGQKQRVSIARAVYSDSDIYLVDDCLSALDAHVGKSILEGVFQNHLQGKTMVIATHHYHYVRPHERVILMKQGRIVEDGLLKDISKRENFKEFSSEEDETYKKGKEVDGGAGKSEDNILTEVQEKKIRKKLNKENKNAQKEDGKLIKKEDRAYGIISWGIYFFYLKSGGLVTLVLATLAFTISSIIELLVSWWVAQWAEQSLELSDIQYFSIYIGLILFLILTMLGKYSLFAVISSTSSLKIFNDLIWNILRRPMSFFDTTSSGMILNRCVDDVSKVDFDIPDKISFIAAMLFQLFTTALLTVVLYPLTIVLMTPAFLLCSFFVKKYMLTTVELKRLNKLSLSPILTSVSELVKGANSNRLFGYQMTMMKKIEKAHNIFMKIAVHEAAVRSWFQLVVDFFFSLNFGFVILFLVISKNMK